MHPDFDRASNGSDLAAIALLVLPWIVSLAPPAPCGERDGQAGPARESRAVPAARGFSSPDARPQAYRLEVSEATPLLAVELAWSGPEDNTLELLVLAPDGRPQGHAQKRPRSRSPSGTRADQARALRRIENPAPGTWTLVVAPGDGTFLDGQGYTLDVAGGSAPLALGSSLTTVVLSPVDGWDSRRAESLLAQGSLASLTASDNDRFTVVEQEFISLAFDAALPAGATITSASISIEHHEKNSTQVGDILWQMGTGPVNAPVVMATAQSPIYFGPGNEATDTVNISAVVNTPAIVNDLKVVVLSTSASGGRSNVDVAELTVTFETGVPPAIISEPVTSVFVGETYVYDPVASGTGPITWSKVSGPGVISVDPVTGRVSATPASTGSPTITIQAANAAGTDTQTFTIDVLPATPPTITSAPPTSGKQGEPFLYDAQASGDGPFTWAKLAGPPELAIDVSTGSFSWIPAAPGSQSVTIEVVSPFGRDEQSFVVAVDPADVAPTIVSSPNLTGVRTQPWLYDANGAAEAIGTLPLSWSVVSGPPGLSIGPNTGALGWIPGVAGNVAISIRVTNVAGSSTQSFVVNVQEPAAPPAITSSPPGNGKVGEAFVYAAQASGTAPLAWSVQAGPPAVTIDATSGLVTWTPVSAGTFGLAIVVSNSAGSDVQNFTVVVDPADVAPTITSVAPTTGKVGETFTYAAQADGTTPLAWSKLAGPASVSVDPASGFVSWNPASAGNFGITLGVTNVAGADTQSFTVVVAPPDVPPTIVSSPDGYAQVGLAWLYDADGSATANGTQPVTWEKVAGPPAFAIDATSGAITWTPETPGPTEITIRATNVAGTDTQTFQLEVARDDVPPSIVSLPSLNANVGTLYLYDEDAAMEALGSRPITWEKLAGPLAITIDPDTGVVTTPLMIPGSFTMTVQASNAVGTDTQTWTILSVVDGTPPVILSTAGTAAHRDVPYAFDDDRRASASGSGPITWSLVSGPPEFALDPVTGLIDWTPATAGPATIRIAATNAYGNDELVFGVDVDGSGTPPNILSRGRTTATSGRPYRYDDDGRAAASGYAPITWSVVSGPPGFAINANTGLVTWTPSTAGVHTVTLRATNPLGTDEVTWSILTRGEILPPRIVSTPTLSGNVGTPYVYDVDAVGAAPLTFALTTGPAGASIDPLTGVLTWTPIVGGLFGFELRAINDRGFDVQAFSVDVQGDAPPVITSTAALTVNVSTPYHYDADDRAEAQSALPVTWSVVSAPAGFAIQPSTGLITWTPNTLGPASISIRATNAAGSDTQSFTVDVQGDAPPVITSVAALVADAFVPYHYDADDRAEAQSTLPVTWTVVSAPAGFAIQPNTGLVTWTPSAAGTATISIRATSAAGADTQTFAVQVLPEAPPVITSVPAAAVELFKPYHYDGNDRAEAQSLSQVAWSVVSAPGGFAIGASSGLVVWTPNAPGFFPITIRATNTGGSDTQSFMVEVTVIGPPLITSTPSATGQMDRGYHYDGDDTVEAVSQSPVSFSLVAGPVGFEVDASTGRVIWTPQAPGSFLVAIRATNLDGSDQQVYAVNVADLPPEPPSFTSVPHRFAFTGVPFRYQPTVAGTGPITFALAGTPTALSVDPDTGRVTGTATASSGTINVNLQATNALGTALQSFTVEVRAGAQSLRLENVQEGWNAATQEFLSAEGSLSAWTSSDNNRFELLPDASAAIEFSNLVPPGSGLNAVQIRIEHSEENGFRAGEFELWLSRGDLRTPVSLATTSPPIRTVDGVYSWNVTAFLNDVEDVDLVLFNRSTNGRSVFLDRAWVLVDHVFAPGEDTIPNTIQPVNPTEIAYLPPERLELGPVAAQQRVNVFLPPGPPPPGGWPVLAATIVGGGTAALPLNTLSKSEVTASFHDLVANGIAVVGFGNTRVGQNDGLFHQPGDPRGRYESFAPADDNPEKETEWAIQWVKSQRIYPFDPERVAVRGQSQGAMNVLWSTMAEDRARASGSRQVRTSTRVRAVLAVHPPTSLWAFDQGPGLDSGVISHYEREAQPGVSAVRMGQVSEETQKNASPMRYAFSTPEALANNAGQRLALVSLEPVTMSGGQPIDMSLDAEGFPVLHDALGVPDLHDSWFAYVFWNRLVGLSPAAAQFHAQNSLFTIADQAALAPPFDTHTDTFSGGLTNTALRVQSLAWLLDSLAE